MRRIAELDGVRGLAAALIVAHHMFPDWLPLGWAAVDIFFVLSGYLITTIVLDHGTSPGFLPSFYVRRGLRIWPLYYLLLLALVFCWRGELAAIPYYATYLQQVPHYWGGTMPSWFGMQHTWTLALEEQFYLVWPALVLLAGRRRTASLALALALGSVAARGVGVDHWTLAARCDGFALGGLLAALLAEPDVERVRWRTDWWAWGSGVAALLLWIGLETVWPLVDPRGMTAYRHQVTAASLTSFALIALVTRSAGRRWLAWLRCRALVSLGTISYGVYIFHVPVLKVSTRLAAHVGVGPGPLLWALQAVLVVGTAVVSWRVIERPILRLKDYFPYTASDAHSVGRSSAPRPEDALAASGA